VANRGAQPRKRVLVVNCYVDETRAPLARLHKVPQPMGPVYLAAAFARDACDVRLYNELSHGPLEDEALLAWPDMLVLTGLTTAIDRMRHLTAYARSKNPAVVVVAGGHAVRALPRYCRTLFDYCCDGDVEQLADVVAEVFGRAWVAERPEPRFDLCNWMTMFPYVETSRYCNFHCRFCTLTGERRPYRPYDLDAVRRDVLAAGDGRIVIFIDNNFYGPDRDFFVARMALLRELTRARRLKGWCALVTSDFFFDDENLRLAKEGGCLALFSGVESFDDAGWLRRNDKRQNAVRPQRELVRQAYEAGIVFVYGLVLDPTTRRLAELRDELEHAVADSTVALPAYCSMSIPLLGTPSFYDHLEAGRLLPSTRVRDLDGTTISLRPLDPLPEVVGFVRDLQSFRGLRAKAARHTVGFLGRYGSRLSWFGLGVAAFQPGLLCVSGLVTGAWRGRAPVRTHVSTTEVLDAQYRPAFPVASRFESWFAPTMLTDRDGALAAAVADDVLAARASAEEVFRDVATAS
jgi:hypothetical protein